MASPKVIKNQNSKILKEALTFDDVLLIPGKGVVKRNEVDISAQLTRKLRLNIPLVSAAMDTVTESRLAIALALEGGIGIIHKNMSIEEQAKEVKKVKKYSSSVIDDPITLSPYDPISKAFWIMKEQNISGFPIVEKGKLVGILTNRDLRLHSDGNIKVSKLMTTKLITLHHKERNDEKKALELMLKNKIEKLPIMDSDGRLRGLITIRDIDERNRFPNAVKDDKGRLLVGAAIGPKSLDRVPALLQAGADVFCLDTAHGHSLPVLNACMEFKKKWPSVQLIGGNIATADAAKDLIKAGVDAVKVGMGPGAICTTRVVTGAGMPQITAILDVVSAAKGVPVIADGGIKYSGDIAKALAAGADTVMMGSLFAGTEESPGKTVFIGGRKFKAYRGMGSIGAMQHGSKDRYFQTESTKLVPEGIEGIVPYRGTLSESVFQLIGGLRSAMGYVGAASLKELKKVRFVQITQASLIEGHPHDITITDEAPNYTPMK